MDKLEHYLDQVCRGIAGPRSLRQHIRQELREHLMDAVSEHENAGVTHEAAIDRALEEFGGPDEVRRELEATHGHRLMTVVVDKAMQWKEKTMKAKWLWTTWVHLALGVVIGLGALFVYMFQTFFAPRIEYLAHERWLTVEGPDAAGISKVLLPFIGGIANIRDNWVWWVIPLLVAWCLFEWRARTENKSLIRLSAMSFVAAVLTAVVCLLSLSVTATLNMGLYNVHRRNPEPDVRTAITELEATLPSLETALAAKNWPAVESSMRKVAQPLWRLNGVGASASVLVSMRESEAVTAVRTQLAKASRAAAENQLAAYNHDESAIEDTVRQARGVLEYVRPTTAPIRQ